MLFVVQVSDDEFGIDLQRDWMLLCSVIGVVVVVGGSSVICFPPSNSHQHHGYYLPSKYLPQYNK